jgi:hypothetical protein
VSIRGDARAAAFVIETAPLATVAAGATARATEAGIVDIWSILGKG